MKTKALVPLLLALVLGVLTFFVGKRVLENQARAALPQVNGTKVLVASAALPAGHQLSSADVKFAQTAETISATMFRDVKDLEGRVLAAPLEPGQVLRQSLLAPVGTSAPLQSKVPAGMRAVTIAVNEFSGLAGLISPGVKVDLVATLVDTVSGETFAKTIVQNVAVSAVGHDMSAGSEYNAKPDARTAQRIHKTVTLLVTPSQAAAIDLAFSKSKPRLVLRSADDEAEVLDDAVTLAELSGRANQDRLAATTKDESSNQVMEMLAAMQKQMEGVAQSSREAAKQAAEEVARQANGAEAELAGASVTPLHSVRVFRGGTETREEFQADGRAAGTNGVAPAPAKPEAAPAKTSREMQQVQGPEGSKPVESGRVAAGE